MFAAFKVIVQVVGCTGYGLVQEQAGVVRIG